MWWKRGQETGRKIIILNPSPLWNDLQNYPTRRLAEKYHTTRRTLTFKLQEINPNKYQEIISKRRTLEPQPPTPIPPETWTQLQNGYSIRKIAIQNNIHPSILHTRIRLQPQYKEIINQRKQNKQHTIQLAAEQFKQGQTLTNLYKKYRIDPPILRSQIQTIIGPRTYHNLIQQTRNNPSNKIPTPTINTAAKLLKQGTKLIDLCRQFHIHRKTLRRRLRQTLGTKYNEIIQQRRTPEQLIQHIAQQFLNGESLNQLSKRYKVSLSTLHRRLPKTIGKTKYKNIITKRLLHTTIGTNGSSRSKYETEIENLLIKNKIPYKQQTLELNGHKYLPDFILPTDPPIIIEATGMNIDPYWIKYQHKLQHYIEAHYQAIFIIPDTSTYNKARKYIHQNILIKYKEFKERIKSLKRVPHKRNTNPTMIGRLSSKSLPPATHPRAVDTRPREILSPSLVEGYRLP